MADNTRGPSIQPTILILFLILGIVPLVVGCLILIQGSRDTYRQVIGSHVSQMADYAQAGVNNYLQRMIIQVAALTTVPAVREVVLEANQSPAAAENLPSAMQEIETLWSQADPTQFPLMTQILNNEASEFLRSYQGFATNFREILVTDAQGRLVAATNPTSDYFQGDEKWWYYSYREGTGGHYISDILFDESSGVYAVEIAEPILQAQTQEVLGVIKAILDSQEIFSLVNSIDVGAEGHAILIRGDGTILISPETTVADQQKYVHFNSLRVGADRGRAFVETEEAEGQVLIGLPQSRFKETFPELDWYLITEQPHNDAFSPFRNINTQFFYILAFSVIVIVGLSLIFSWLLSKPVIETDPHLERL